MKKLAAWLPALLWMGGIFAMSAMPGDVSGAQSGAITQLLCRALCRALGSEAPPLRPETIHLLLRKGAHMAEYAVLYLLLHRALRLSGAGRPAACALLLCAAYAATDEWHQRFVPGRGPSPADVAIDTAGTALAALTTGALRRRRNQRISVDI